MDLEEKLQIEEFSANKEMEATYQVGPTCVKQKKHEMFEGASE